MSYKIIEIAQENINQYPAVCFISHEHPGYIAKKEWLNERFKEGMKIKLLFEGQSKKANAFIEYIPGKYAWRAVKAINYMFIHCLWVSPNTSKNKGFASKLISECEQDAMEKGFSGVAVICSSDSFMVDNQVFVKNGYDKIQHYQKYVLLVKNFKNDELPQLIINDSSLSKYIGLHIIYSCQCPWVARFIDEVKPFLDKLGINPVITQLKSAKEAQMAPSIYSVFNLVYNGKLLAEHYISTTRFVNIINKLK